MHSHNEKSKEPITYPLELEAVNNFIREKLSKIIQVNKESIEEEIELESYGISSLALTILLGEINSKFSLDLEVNDLPSPLTLNSIFSLIINQRSTL